MSKKNRLDDPQHKQIENDRQYIAKLEKQNKRLWIFIMENCEDVSSLLKEEDLLEETRDRCSRCETEYDQGDNYCEKCGNKHNN